MRVAASGWALRSRSAPSPGGRYHPGMDYGLVSPELSMPVPAPRGSRRPRRSPSASAGRPCGRPTTSSSSTPRRTSTAGSSRRILALAHVGARHPRLRLGTSVIVVPQRQCRACWPRSWRRSTRCRGGRVIAGVGIGWDRVEFANLGMADRFARPRRLPRRDGRAVAPPVGRSRRARSTAASTTSTTSCSSRCRRRRRRSRSGSAGAPRPALAARRPPRRWLPLELDLARRPTRSGSRRSCARGRGRRSADADAVGTAPRLPDRAPDDGDGYALRGSRTRSAPGSPSGRRSASTHLALYFVSVEPGGDRPRRGVVRRGDRRGTNRLAGPAGRSGSRSLIG